MTAFGGSPGCLLGDADPAWTTVQGAVRVRACGGLVQLQVSVDNGDGTWVCGTDL